MTYVYISAVALGLFGHLMMGSELVVTVVGVFGVAVAAACALWLAGVCGEWLNRRGLDDGVEEIKRSKRRHF